MNETGQSFNQKIVFSDIPGQNIWNEVKKSSKTGQNYKTFLYIFAYLFTAIAKSSNSGCKSLLKF